MATALEAESAEDWAGASAPGRALAPVLVWALVWAQALV
jgi:hypothetical protein